MAEEPKKAEGNFSNYDSKSSMSDPTLPEPLFPDLDSMLSRKFGKEVANYFSGSPINRVSFLRPDHTFLSSALKHPSTSFLLYNKLQPLTKNSTALATVTYKEVQPIIGDDPYSLTEEEQTKQYNSSKYTPQLVFLGLDERNQQKNDESKIFTYKDRYKGAPYFALDVTPQDHIAAAASSLISSVEKQGLEFAEGRMLLSFPASEAAIYALGRHLLDWNARNPFCAQCGQPTLSVNGGWKRACPPSDMADVDSTATSSSADTPVKKRRDCATRGGVSNVSFPRTDPTVIMAIISADGQKVLLGRQKRWPPQWYSTLAGFLEPAESVEEAVRREVWEEAGVQVGRVVMHSTQPWPYPANIMIGAIGQAVPEGETIDLGHDAELEDARWYSLEEVREALKEGASPLGEPAPEGYKEGALRLPPKTAIAWQLINSLVNGGILGGITKM